MVLHGHPRDHGDVSTRDMGRAALVALIWGVNFVVIEWGMRGIPPLLFVAIRFTLVAVPAVFLVRRPDAPWRVILGVGVFMSLGQFALLYTAIGLGMPPGIAALVLQAQVILTILVAAAVLRDIPTPVQLAGVVLGTVGLLVVALGRDAATSPLALLVALGAALSWAVGNVIVRASGVKGGLGLTVWSALAVPLPALGLSLLLDGPRAVVAGLGAFGLPALASTAFTVVLATMVGYGIFTSLLSSHPAAAVVPWILLVPPIAITAGWVFLGQRPNLAETLGGVLLLLGVLIANLPRGRSRSTALNAREAAPAALR